MFLFLSICEICAIFNNNDKIIIVSGQKTMMNFLRKHTRIIFIATIIAFIGGTFMGFGNYLFGRKNNPQTAVTVNNNKIPMKLFNSFYTYSVEIYKKTINRELTKNDLNELKNKIIQMLIQEEIFYQQSKLYNITVTDEELKTDLQNSEMFRNNNVFDIRKYYSFLNFIKMTPKEYEAIRKKQIAGSKVKDIISFSVKLWNYELENSLKQDPTATKESLINTKINLIINEWYSNIIKNSKITINNIIFK
jgi:hypothetical protein